MKKIYLLLILTAILTSCQEKNKSSNENEEDISSTELQSKSSEKIEEQPKWKEEEIKIHNEKIKVGEEKLKMAFNGQIESIEEELKKTNEELEEIKEFEIGRSQSTKDNQLSNKYEEKDMLRKALNNLKMEYVKIPLHETFDFQNSPKGVVEHLFLGFKNKDFEKFSSLCDPYFEAKGEYVWLCNIEALPGFAKDKLFEKYANPRIIGEPNIQDDKATIEIATGPNSDKLEKVNLVRRLDKWYLSRIQ
ncbi:hypothetical protein [Salegentibacter sp. Hel_I_6]|uniref:hypothetical protein n=1 Tax=Salegentibacter sp. Hel_I_6 TaxID=1250278 RepID=UPI0005690FD1|nr:hypothetical protein [Salegentibacter sp. Hel_I_6]